MRRPVRLFTSALFLSFAAVLAHAQSLPEGVHMGMTVDELRAAVPSAERVPRPQRLSGGLAGTWRGAPAVVGGLPLAPTFYFAGARLQRVEFSASATSEPDLGAQAFNEIVSWGRGSFGQELASTDGASQYAAWSQGGVDVYAQRMGDPRHAAVRIVYAARERKDDSTL
ncbi:hypothetical protein QTI66_18295 [Variovorax sp. J22R133]|uniref:hypothetical protein n=1 Tax=Variovorax brevis TaxID=3053503 RepID=UPI0025783073|nr:hypothetical protein [Variovorax sp. J22R133]MDM0114110.1 hypothetical protein [Variovorax sp. J22R133]